MNNISHSVCPVIPEHVFNNIARNGGRVAAGNARSTLEQMREIGHRRIHRAVVSDLVVQSAVGALNRRRNVYTALHRQQLPGKLVMSEHKARGTDIDVNQAYDGAGATFDFYARVHGRNSIDNRGMRIDSTVHYSVGFDNAMWDGRQMVYGDGDGILFTSFTGQLEVIAHEITHGVTQHSANLGYFGETGALNEHVSDVEGILVKQFTFRQTARESDWYIGKGLFTNAVRGKAIRSMAAPGTAYDDPVLGRDPQPAHMRDYVDTDDDNGGVHINSGILNHAFYLNAIALGGYAWEVAGTIWYVTLTERLPSSAGFDDFAQLTIDVAGEMFGNGGRVQQIVIANWFKVGLLPRLPPTQSPIAPRPQPTPLTTNIRKENTIMSTEHTDLQHNHITASMNTLGVMENSAIADTPNGRVQHLVKIYGRVKPFLLLLSTLVVLPTSWRDGIKVFIGALDAVAVVAPQLGPGEIITIDDPQPVPEFKAGKDL